MKATPSGMGTTHSTHGIGNDFFLLIGGNELSIVGNELLTGMNERFVPIH